MPQSALKSVFAVVAGDGRATSSAASRLARTNREWSLGGTEVTMCTY